MDTVKEILSGDLRLPIRYSFLDDGFAVFVLKENIVTLDYINKKFTSLKPFPTDFTDAHIEGGLLNGFGDGKFYTVNYQELNQGGELYINEYPYDDTDNCTSVSGSADAYCDGKFIVSGIVVGAKASKSAIVDSFTLHLNDKELHAISTDYTLKKEIMMNRDPLLFCSTDNATCFTDIDGKKYCAKDNETAVVVEFPDNCAEASLVNGVIEDKNGHSLLKFAEKVNESDSAYMWRRETLNGIYYFFTKK